MSMTKTEMVANLKEMLEDTQGGVQNEGIWANGSFGEEQKMHQLNKRGLEIRAELLELIINVLEEKDTVLAERFEDAICAVLYEEELADSEYVEMLKELKEQYC